MAPSVWADPRHCGRSAYPEGAAKDPYIRTPLAQLGYMRRLRTMPALQISLPRVYRTVLRARYDRRSCTTSHRALVRPALDTMGFSHRQVHFAEGVAPTSPIAIPLRSEGSTSSPASSLSSAGPHTPPTAPFYHARTIPLPPVTPRMPTADLPGLRSPSTSSNISSLASSLRPHVIDSTPVPLSAVLAAAANGGKPRLKWDMASDPQQSVYDRELRQTVPSLALNEPAASPDVTHIVITISGAMYPYEIVVERPTAPTAPLFVSVRDVLAAIHDNLRCPVTAVEQQRAAVQNPHAWRAAVEAHARRAMGRPGVPMRRIDFLAGKTVFFGLVSKGYDGKVPRLSLRVGPRDSP